MRAQLTLDSDKIDSASTGYGFGYKRNATVGLNAGYYGGVFISGGALTTIADGTIALTASQTNYVERTKAGVVSKNTSGFTAGSIPMFTATTDGTDVLVVTDKRQRNVFGDLKAVGRLTLTGANDALSFTGAAANPHYLEMINTGGQGRLGIEGSSGGQLATGSSAYATVVGSTAARSLHLFANGVVGVTLDVSGNLGVGVTPKAWGANRHAIEMSGSSTGYFSCANGPVALSSNLYYDTVDRFVGNGYGGIIAISGGSIIFITTNNNSSGADAAAALTQSMKLDQNGYLYLPAMASGGTTNMHWSSTAGQLFYVTSSLRYKHDIRDLEDMDLNLLRPVRYKSNNAEVDGDGDYFGFIAEEAHEKGLVELVGYRDGVPDSFHYDRVTVPLVKAVQRQTKQIAKLAAAVGVTLH